MGLITLLLAVCIIGFVAWLIYQAPFIQPLFKHMAMIVCVIVAGLIILNAFGVLTAIRDVQVPRVK